MNHIHRLVFNASSNTWVAVAENARGRGKGSSRKLVAAALSLAVSLAQAAPQGGTVASGAGTITQAGAATTITQTTPNLSLNWKSFDIGAAESVKFVQPSATSVAVNRIYDTNGSQILGRLSANGQVYLINPNGILFGANAQVNVAGLHASTQNLNNTGTGTGFGPGSIVNHGILTAINGGFITLQADNLTNTGLISVRTDGAQAGTIKMLGDMRFGVVNVGGTLDASAPFGGNGGFVETSASVVKIGTRARVTTQAAKGLSGTWLIDPKDYTIAATGGDISGATLSANLETTSVSIFSSSGVATVGSGDINVNDALTWRASNTLTLTASNNVNINANIVATGATAGLVLKPATANGADAAVSSGRYKLKSGVSVTLSGSNPLLNIAGKKYTVINSLGAEGSTTGKDLQGMDPAGNYALGSNLDAAPATTWNTNTGFMSVGPFTGTFEGLGNTIANLTINRAGLDVGLFGKAATAAIIQNVGLINASVTGTTSVGSLVAENAGTINNSYAIGKAGGTLVQATTGGGGLVGVNIGTINNSTTSGSIYATTNAGGLVGTNMGTVNVSTASGAVSGAAGVGGLVGANSGTVNTSSATGPITGVTSGGGLVGINAGTVEASFATGVVNVLTNSGGLVGASTGKINNSYASGASSGTTSIGGLVGDASGTVTLSYASGPAAGLTGVGGLIGLSTAAVSGSHASGTADATTGTGGLIGIAGAGSSVTLSYATGATSGLTATGGLLGSSLATVSKSYATGQVLGTGAAASTGGLVGENSGAVTDSYAKGKVTGVTDAGGLVGTNSGSGSIKKTYASGVVSGSKNVGALVGWNYSLQSSDSYWDASINPALPGVGNGNMPATSKGLSAAEMLAQASFTGWDMGTTWAMPASGGSPVLKPLLLKVTVAANNATKIYDGGIYAGGYSATFSDALVGAALGPISFSGTALLATAVGKYAVAPMAVGFNNPQYVVTYTAGVLTIDKALVKVSMAGTRPYDGTANVASSIFTLSGLAAGENLSLAGVGTVADKNVGNDKVVALGTLKLGDGTGSGAGLASNYTFVGGTQKASITRLNSVTWTGGLSGNWFDPANWGGAVPDLSNVANVVIPANVNVSFNTGALGAPANTVNLDNINSAGANGTLNLVAGNLNVVSNLKLSTLVQSGGVLGGTANVTLGSLNQSGGTVASGGAFTVGTSFAQTGAGKVSVDGSVVINQAVGDLRVLNLSGANVALASGESMVLGNVATTGKLSVAYGQSSGTGGANGYTVTAPINLAAGDNFSTQLGGAGAKKDYTVVTSLGSSGDVGSSALTLQGMASTLNVGKNFVLGSNIDAQSTSKWNLSGPIYEGFFPIGSASAAFTGAFDGLGHTINGLVINRPGAIAGLFGAATGVTEIRNVGLVGGSTIGGAGGTGGLLGTALAVNISNSYNTGNVAGGASTGGLVGSSLAGLIIDSYTSGSVDGGAGTGGVLGYSEGTHITNSHASGNVTGTAGTGGLVGTSLTGNFTNSYATGNVRGGAGTGGLVGINTAGNFDTTYATGNVGGVLVAGVATPAANVGGLVGSITTGKITNSHATGDVSGAPNVGGLVGSGLTGDISKSYATGKVLGSVQVGGLVGSFTSAAISESYALGNVEGGSMVGGLVGVTTGPIRDSYATGVVLGTGVPVTNASSVGGLVGSTVGTITNSYAAGASKIGTDGLVGTSQNTVVNSYWDAQLGPPTSSKGTALNSTEMLSASKFVGWDFVNTWGIYTGTAPLLKSVMTPVTVQANDVSKMYDGQSYVGLNSVRYIINGVSYAATPSAGLGVVTYGGDWVGQTNAGSYTVTPGGLQSNQQFLVTYASGKLDIVRAPLAVNISGTRVYDGSANVAAAIFTLSGLVSGESLSLSGLGTVADKNVGVDKAVSVGSLALGDGAGAGAGLARNYTLTGGDLKATITRLDSVTWTGGSTGSWFDPANWGGAVPDLANVAHVLIPSGVTVNFNNGVVVSPALAGSVNIDSINANSSSTTPLSGGLNMMAGTLSIANSLQLGTLNQTGGVLSGTGSIAVTDFAQTGGAVLNSGALTVGQSFKQTLTGRVNVGGDVTVKQAAGNLAVNDLTGNNVTLSAGMGSVTLGAVTANGALNINARTDITQTAAVAVAGDAKLSSTIGDITLTHADNDFKGMVLASARNISLVDINALTVDLKATGNSSLVAGGDLTVSGKTVDLTTLTTNGGRTLFGDLAVAGNLSTVSSGEVSKIGVLTVGGKASVTAAGQDVTTVFMASTASPTAAPTTAPTTSPTAEPTQAPTQAPTVSPTAAPTASPTGAPTAAPIAAPTTPPPVVLGNAEDASARGRRLIISYLQSKELMPAPIKDKKALAAASLEGETPALAVKEGGINLPDESYVMSPEDQK